MRRSRMTEMDRERLDHIDERRDERGFSQNYDIPRHVLRDELSVDDDPDLMYYNPDRFDE